MPRFVWSDAWILTAILLAQREGCATLEGVIRFADLINKAIPTDDEINGALERLVRKDLVSVQGAEILATAKLLSDAERRTLDTVNRVRKYLHAGRWTSATPVGAPPTGSPLFSSVEIARAYRRYSGPWQG